MCVCVCLNHTESWRRMRCYSSAGSSWPRTYQARTTLSVSHIRSTVVDRMALKKKIKGDSRFYRMRCYSCAGSSWPRKHQARTVLSDSRSSRSRSIIVCSIPRNT